MITIQNKETGEVLGEITREHLQYLIDQLEEEYEGDNDYYINKDTLDVFEKKGIDQELLTFLRRSLGNREEMEIVWFSE